MKKRARLVDLADLLAIAHYDEDLVLFIDSEEGNIPTTLCVEANFDTLEFGKVQPIADYLATHSYQSIQDVDVQISCRQRILEEMKPEAIVAMLKEFNQTYLNELQKLGFVSKDDAWEPGG